MAADKSAAAKTRSEHSATGKLGKCIDSGTISRSRGNGNCFVILRRPAPQEFKNHSSRREEPGLCVKSSSASSRAGYEFRQIEIQPCRPTHKTFLQKGLAWAETYVSCAG